MPTSKQNFSIDDGRGTLLVAGLPEHMARSHAVGLANSREESVFLYAEGSQDAPEEIRPDLEPEQAEDEPQAVAFFGTYGEAVAATEEMWPTTVVRFHLHHTWERTGRVEYFDSYDAAVAAARAIWSAAHIGHDGDIECGGDRTLVWSSDEDSQDDDGSRAVASIRRCLVLPGAEQ